MLVALYVLVGWLVFSLVATAACASLFAGARIMNRTAASTRRSGTRVHPAA